jgi:hypothetical protein
MLAFGVGRQRADAKAIAHTQPPRGRSCAGQRRQQHRRSCRRCERVAVAEQDQVAAASRVPA